MRAIGFVALLALVAAVQAVTSDCRGRVLRNIPFPLLNYTDFNPFLANNTAYQTLENQLVNGQCNPRRDPGQVCAVTPSFGSGLTRLPSGLLLGLTDRGPNQDCQDLCSINRGKYAQACNKNGKGFPVPDFAPSFAKFRLNNFTVQITSTAFFKTVGGPPMSGVSSTQFDDIAYGPDCNGERLPLDPNGIDPEDAHAVPGTNGVLAVVEEYSPSILLSRPDGTVFARYVPRSIAPLLAEADTNVYGILPDVFKNRRPNRGFESLVVAPSGAYLIAILQSPMGETSNPQLAANRIGRAVVMAVQITNQPREPVRLTLARTFAIEFSPVSSYSAASSSDDIMFSAARALDDDRFLLLERSEDQVKWFSVQWRNSTNLQQTAFAGNLRLERQTAGVVDPRELGVVPAMKVKIMDTDPRVPGGINNFFGSDKQEGFTLLNTNQILTVNDNDFGLDQQGPITLTQILIGRTLDGPTVCGRPEVPSPPQKNTELGAIFGGRQIMNLSNEPDTSNPEIITIDRTSNSLFTANAQNGSVGGYARDPLATPALTAYATGPDSKVNSVDLCSRNGFVAAAVENASGPGSLMILDPQTGDDRKPQNLTLVEQFTPDNCFLPDAVKWSNDCSYIVVACEGEGADVPGGVLVWSALTNSVTVATFDAYDSPSLKAALDQQQVRYFQSDQPSMALEPEFSAFTSDSNYAYVALQENNAIAVVDLAEAKVTEIKPLIYTPRSVPGYGIDASDQDGRINIRTYPSVFGMCQPDSIVNFVVNDMNYFAVACEGDAWPDIEEIEAGDIEDTLGRQISDELKLLVDDPALLGRLEVSSQMGFNAATNTQEALYHFGARSFQIYRLDGACVLDSGDWIERIHQQQFPKIFNAEWDPGTTLEDNFDARSPAKGPEPESLTISVINGRQILFVGNERTSVLMAFDVSNPPAPTYLTATIQTPTNVELLEVFATGQQGIIDPESLAYHSGFLYVGSPFAGTVTKVRFITGNLLDEIPCRNDAERCHCARAADTCLEPTELNDGRCVVTTCSTLQCLCPVLPSPLTKVPANSRLCSFRFGRDWAPTGSAAGGTVPCVEVLELRPV